MRWCLPSTVCWIRNKEVDCFLAKSELQGNALRYGKNYNASATFTSGKQFTPKGNSRTYGVPFTNAQCLIHRLRAVPVEPPKAVGRKASFALESPNNVGSAHTRQGYSPCTSQGNDSLDLQFFRTVSYNSRTHSVYFTDLGLTSALKKRIIEIWSFFNRKNGIA